MSDPTSPPPSRLERPDGSRLAYHATPAADPGDGRPGVVFCGGFMSDMTGTKATALEAYARREGLAYVRFDYFGHGASSGAFTDGTIGRWAEDVVAVLDEVTEGPQVLVGSSMGGWIMLLAALRRPGRIAGLVGTAAAPDFTEDLIPAQLSPAQLGQLERDGFTEIPNCYDDEPYRIAKTLIDEGRDHLLLRAEIPLDCPVRLIHGTDDEDVPWQTSQTIARMLRSTDVEVTFVKNGDHRLSEPRDLARLTAVVGRLVDELSPPGP